LPIEDAKEAGNTSTVEKSSSRKLNGWKEIAEYIGRALRTVQRWESQYHLPVHRPSGKDRSAVIALADEIDSWLQSTSIRGSNYVRPTLIVVDSPQSESLSNRKLSLEIAKFNVLTVFSAAELRATADRFKPDGFIVDATTRDEDLLQMCGELKQHFPKARLILLGSDDVADLTHDRLIDPDDVKALLNAAYEDFGTPRIL
jgi:hypothetical protein